MKKSKKFRSIRIKILCIILLALIITVISTIGISYTILKNINCSEDFFKCVIIFLPSIIILLCMIMVVIALVIDYNIVHPINNLTKAAGQFAYDTNDKRKENVEQIFSLKYNKRNDEIGKLYSAIAMMTKESTEFDEDIQLQASMISKMQDGLIMVLSEMVESRDEGTGDHIKKTKTYVEIIIDEMKKQKIYEDQLTEKMMSNTIKSAPLHDIGKIHIPDSILTKPGKLTDEEFEIMKTHTTYGAKMIQYTIEQISDDEIGYLAEAKNVAEFHHEKWNGQGYPHGLSGEDIPLSARIMAVADVFDALSSRRSYKEPFPFDKTLQIIEEGAGNHFDPLVVKAFLDRKEEVKRVLDSFEK